MNMTREYTKMERFQNWLYYNKIWLIVGAIFLWVAGSMLWNILGIGQIKPDYRVAYVGSRRLPEETVAVLENALASFGEDVNGDGRVAVTLTQHITADRESMDNMTYSYAAEITVLADVTAGESVFFLLENPVDFQLSFQILAHRDGRVPAEDDFEALDKVFRWADCPALAALELGTYEDSYLDLTETGEIQELLANLCLGRRYFLDEKQNPNPEANERFWQSLTEGANP